MKIAYLCLEHKQSRFHISGYAVHLNEMIGAMEANGHEVYPMVLGEWLARPGAAGTTRAAGGGRGLKQTVKDLIPGPLWEGMKDLRVLYYDKKFREKIFSEVKNFGPDMIYEQTPFLSFSGTRLARALDLPNMLELHAPMVDERTRDGMKSLLSGVARKRENLMLARAGRIRTVSSALKAHIVERGINADKIVVQPNGVDVDKFSGEADRDIRQELGASGKVVVGFTGSFFRWHGIDALIDGFALAHKSNPDTHLLIVGDGENMAELQQQRVDTGLEDAITFTGNLPHDQVPDYIRAMDICVMPNSNWYGSPLKIFEYGAAGKAVIAPDLIPIHDIMEDGTQCLMVRPGNREDLGAAMVKLVEDASLRNSIARTFQEKVRKEYTWKQVAANLLSCMDQIRRS